MTPEHREAYAVPLTGGRGRICLADGPKSRRDAW